MAFAFAGLMKQMIKSNHFMDMDDRNAEIVGDILFSFGRNEALFFLNEMQHRQKRGPFFFVVAGDLV